VDGLNRVIDNEAIYFLQRALMDIAVQLEAAAFPWSPQDYQVPVSTPKGTASWPPETGRVLLGPAPWPSTRASAQWIRRATPNFWRCAATLRRAAGRPSSMPTR